MIRGKEAGNLRKVLALLSFVWIYFIACTSTPEIPQGPADSGDPLRYRQRMRELVISLSRYAHSRTPRFIVIPQNGSELLTVSGEPGAAPASEYINAIDGVGREDLFYGYTADNRETPPEATAYMMSYLKPARDNGLSVVVIDYCRQRAKIDDSYSRNQEARFISFAADLRDLSGIPRYPDPIYAEHGGDVNRLDQARNALFLLNPGKFDGRERFLSALRRTNHDLIVIDAFVDGPDGLQWLEPEEIHSLKTKANGAERLVISYLSIGEAETYRYYWDRSWDRNRDGRPDAGAPEWLKAENPKWKGNFKVRYWDADWQAILFGDSEAYLDQIISRGFDGVYLDIIDAFEYFENLDR